MINLFDSYSQETRDLYHSLKTAGFESSTIVIEANGFLPDDIMSPYLYFLNNKKDIERGCFFNEIEVPEFWEISGSNSSAVIKNYEKEQARINFNVASNNRIVETVEWLDEQGRIYLIDKYDKYGNRFAQTTVSTEGQWLITTYFDSQNKERIVENYLTNDIILTLDNEPIQIFKGKVDFIKYFISYLNLEQDHIFYNTLSYSFLVSHYSKDIPGHDVLFWQEPLGDEIPGNMSLIFDDIDHRTKKVVMPDIATYQRAKELLPKEKHDKIAHLGYVYQFNRENEGRKEAFIFTNSDQIEGLDEIVQELSDFNIHIAARTEMSSHLTSMVKYKNVVIYQNISQEGIDRLFNSTDLYLDINYYNEVMSSVRRAFDNNMLIMAFSETAHNPRYIASDLVFSKERRSDMIERIKMIFNDKSSLQRDLELQHQQANAISFESFKEGLNHILGEV